MPTERLVRLRRGFTTTDRPPQRYRQGDVVAVTPCETPGVWVRTERKTWFELLPGEWEEVDG